MNEADDALGVDHYGRLHLPQIALRNTDTSPQQRRQPRTPNRRTSHLADIAARHVERAIGLLLGIREALKRELVGLLELGGLAGRSHRDDRHNAARAANPLEVVANFSQMLATKRAAEVPYEQKQQRLSPQLRERCRSSPVVE